MNKTRVIFLLAVTCAVVLVGSAIQSKEKDNLSHQVSVLNAKLQEKIAIRNATIEMVQKSRIDAEVAISQVMYKIQNEEGLPDPKSITALQVSERIIQDGELLHRQWKPEDFKYE